MQWNPHISLERLRKLDANPDKYKKGDNLELLEETGDMLLDLLDAHGLLANANASKREGNGHV